MQKLVLDQIQHLLVRLEVVYHDMDASIDDHGLQKAT